jgi:hypothetical protein
LTGSSFFTKVLCFLAVEVLMLFALMVVLLAPIYPLFLIVQLLERLMFT